MAELVFLGVGANLGDRRGQLNSGLAALCAVDGVEFVGASSLYESAPVGYVEQPPFLNAVIQVLSRLEPLELLDAIQRIELDHHRQRDLHWGPRTLDLDLLLHGSARLESQTLRLPHPHMLERAFVLVPLVELAPSLRHPCTGLPMALHRRRLGRDQALRPVGEFTRPPIPT